MRRECPDWGHPEAIRFKLLWMMRQWPDQVLWLQSNTWAAIAIQHVAGSEKCCHLGGFWSTSRQRPHSKMLAGRLERRLLRRRLDFWRDATRRRRRTPPLCRYRQMDQQQEEPPPFSSLFGDVDDGSDDGSAGGGDEPPLAQLGTIDETDLRAVTRRIGDKLPQVPCRRRCPSLAGAPCSAVAELHYRAELIGRHMGSLALCRGSRGDALHEAGAVGAALCVLAVLNRDVLLHTSRAWTEERDSMQEEVTAQGLNTALTDADDMVSLQPILVCDNAGGGGNHSYSQESNEIICWSALDQATVALASACIGSIRDMSCGNASNRAAVSECRTKICPSSLISDDATTVTGPEILASYVRRYHKLHWEDILDLEGGSGRDGRGRKELRLLTDATGAIRNSSHSTPKTCAGLHLALVTKMFIWRLKQGSKDDSPENVPACLPDASRPWREASFRIAGSLINISERCSDCANFCGSDLDLIRLLVEAWGGAGTTKAAVPNGKTKQTPASTPMLHLGLAAILHAADAISPLDESLRSILEKENARKEFARKKEAERQKRIAQGLK